MCGPHFGEASSMSTIHGGASHKWWVRFRTALLCSRFISYILLSPVCGWSAINYRWHVLLIRFPHFHTGSETYPWMRRTGCRMDWRIWQLLQPPFSPRTCERTHTHRSITQIKSSICKVLKLKAKILAVKLLTCLFLVAGPTYYIPSLLNCY